MEQYNIVVYVAVGGVAGALVSSIVNGFFNCIVKWKEADSTLQKTAAEFAMETFKIHSEAAKTNSERDGVTHTVIPAEYWLYITYLRMKEIDGLSLNEKKTGKHLSNLQKIDECLALKIAGYAKKQEEKLAHIYQHGEYK